MCPSLQMHKFWERQLFSSICQLYLTVHLLNCTVEAIKSRDWKSVQKASHRWTDPLSPHNEDIRETRSSPGRRRSLRTQFLHIGGTWGIEGSDGYHGQVSPV